MDDILYLWFRPAARTDRGEGAARQLDPRLGGEVVAARVDGLFLGSRNSGGGRCRVIGRWISDRGPSHCTSRCFRFVAEPSFIIRIRDKEVIREILTEILSHVVINVLEHVSKDLRNINSVLES
jgi:hypothetical protein